MPDQWTSQSEPLRDDAGQRFTLRAGDRPATVAEVLREWRESESFRSFFNALLADAPYKAYRWETPATTPSSLWRPFEFVLIEDPALDRRPDHKAFAEHFGQAPNGVAVFPNLGGDAIMVVPCPVADSSAYGHLAAFVRHAPESQRHALWQAVADAMLKRLGRRPVWLSTAGAGVAWLHVRLDDRPKYYGYAAYRQI